MSAVEELNDDSKSDRHFFGEGEEKEVESKSAAAATAEQNLNRESENEMIRQFGAEL
jgi:hypothetical protein